MSRTAPVWKGRLLGLPQTRVSLVSVEIWIPSSQDEVAAMPVPAAYPTVMWDLAYTVLRDSERDRQLYEEQAARERGKRTGSEDTVICAPATTLPQQKVHEPVAAPLVPPAGYPVVNLDESARGPALGGAPDAGSADHQEPPVPERSDSQPLTAHGALVRSVDHLVRRQPEDAAKLVRTMVVGADSDPRAGDHQRQPSSFRAPDGDAVDYLPVLVKVAILFVALGRETSGGVLKYLSDYEMERVTQAIANLKNVSVAQQDKVLEEFGEHLRGGAWVIQGGMDFARQALGMAVGPHKAQEILDRMMHTVSSGFSMLKNVAPDQIAPFISQEHPQTIALILSQLESPQAAGIITHLPKRLQADVAYRIATMENIPPTALRQIEESLEATLRDILGGNKDVGGPKVTADILNLTGSIVEKNVLDQMDAQDPEVAESVRNLMFTFTDIVKLSDREIQILMREVDQKDLVVALKGASEELKVKILNNMSEEVRAFICEQMEFTGPMRLSEVEEVQLRIVQELRQLEERGQITVFRGDSKGDAFV